MITYKINVDGLVNYYSVASDPQVAEQLLLNKYPFLLRSNRTVTIATVLPKHLR